MPFTKSNRRRRVTPKFVFERQGRKPIVSTKSVHSIGDILRAAEFLYTKTLPPHSRMIFIGTGMRPVFDAVRALNETKQERSRRDFRYFVTPDQDTNREILQGGNERAIFMMAQSLMRRKIVVPKKKNYYVVDFNASGTTFRVLAMAIRRVAPNARVHNLYTKIPQPMRNALFNSDAVGRPTKKELQNDRVVVLPGYFPYHNANYLSFQRAIHDWLRTRKDNS